VGDAVVPPAGPPELTVAELGSIDDLLAVRDEWDELAVATGDPFGTTAWLAAWWGSFGTGVPAVLTVRDPAGRLVAGLACRRPARSAGTWRAAADDESGSWGLVAADDDARRRAWAALADAGPGRLLLTGLDTGRDVPLAREALVRAGYRVVDRPGPRSPYLALPATMDQLLRSRSRNLRKQVNHRRNQLARQGPIELRVVRGGADLAPALDAALRLEGTAWKVRAGTAILSDPRRERLFRGFTAAAADRGWLRVVLLEVGGEPVAADLAVAFAGAAHVLKTGFDDRYERFSPGLVLRAEAIRAAIDEGLTGYAFLGSADDYKLRWTEELRPQAGLRAYRGARTLPESVYWSAARPALRRVALHTVRRPARAPDRPQQPPAADQPAVAVSSR
jgi:CelD/BcsL family acetyltransferase involved in cellulose biosynthesis